MTITITALKPSDHARIAAYAVEGMNLDKIVTNPIALKSTAEPSSTKPSTRQATSTPPMRGRN